METVVRMDGAVALVLEKLVEKGYYRTKSEAIRAGILELGREYGLAQDPRDLEADLVIRKVEKINREIDEGKRKLIPLEEVLKKSRAMRK
ncbi:MAG TPA: hypothetical protein VI874_01135 [Candidatus Norongarragalinales archaeon]|nr:hypothetical protein [Candidatus Norongarragalinales archaeon]